jgi:hypothetical protein
LGPAATSPSGNGGVDHHDDLRQRGLLSADGLFDATSIAFADSLDTEAFPTSPLILNPFQDALVIPKALAAEPWIEYTNWKQPPGPGVGQQNSLGNERHQVWCNDPRVHSPDLLVYKLEPTVAGHSFTTSPVLPIDSDGKPTHSYDQFGNRVAPGPRVLPASTIYGFNGTFPGPMINNEYGRPAVVRFINRLDENPMNLDRQDFGAPDASFLTHLHNAHTAPESDGNPHYSMVNGPKYHGYSLADHGMWFDTWPLVQHLPDEQRPLHMTFGDDSKISPERIQEWVDPSDEFGMPINWSEGDVGVICNYRSAHGRPDIHLGDGEARKLGVVLGDQYDRVGVRTDKW